MGQVMTENKSVKDFFVTCTSYFKGGKTGFMVLKDYSEQSPVEYTILGWIVLFMSAQVLLFTGWSVVRLFCVLGWVMSAYGGLTNAQMRNEIGWHVSGLCALLVYLTYRLPIVFDSSVKGKMKKDGSEQEEKMVDKQKKPKKD